MENFIIELRNRNEPMFHFGWACFIAATIFIVLSLVDKTTVSGANAWYKPFKFALSIGIYSFTMAWYVSYLPQFNVRLFSYTIIILLGFELLYIAIQAGRGQLSHFNISTPLYSALYSAMAIAATMVTLYTAYIGMLFVFSKVNQLPDYYLLAIQIGIFLFVIFSLEGFVMGGKLSHTIGGEDSAKGIPILNWSLKHGDLRIPHFIGMHALQIVPILSFYLLKSIRLTVVVGVIYSMLAIYTLVQALLGKSLIKI